MNAMTETGAGFFEKIAAFLLRSFAAIDRRLLLECDDAEKKKFVFTGLLVFIITLLTAISSFYALTDYLLPEGSVHDAVWYVYLLLCLFLACCWSAIVFNLFRFFVTSVPITDQAGWSGAGDFASLMVQMFFCLVLAVVLGFPIAILMLDSQITFQGKELQRSSLKDVSMTVAFIDQHPRLPELQAAYRKLERLKLDEKALQVQLGAVKDQGEISVDAQAEIRMNQAKQETELKKIQGIRRELDAEFHTLLEKNHSMHLVGKSRFIWQHNLPVTLFIILFIFIVYASLIFSKFLLARGKYEHLMKFEQRTAAIRNGIVEVRSPLYIDKELVRFHRFGTPEAIQAVELKLNSEKKHQIHEYLQEQLEEKTRIALQVLGRLRSR